jgi:hypothetical protein
LNPEQADPPRDFTNFANQVSSLPAKGRLFCAPAHIFPDFPEKVAQNRCAPRKNVLFFIYIIYIYSFLTYIYSFLLD